MMVRPKRLLTQTEAEQAEDECAYHDNCSTNICWGQFAAQDRKTRNVIADWLASDDTQAWIEDNGIKGIAQLLREGRLV